MTSYGVGKNKSTDKKRLKFAPAIKHFFSLCVDFLKRKTISYFAGELTLVAIGPLTNVALAIRLDPEFGKNLKECYIMGGNYEGALQYGTRLVFSKFILQL